MLFVSKFGLGFPVVQENGLRGILGVGSVFQVQAADLVYPPDVALIEGEKAITPCVEHLCFNSFL